MCWMKRGDGISYMSGSCCLFFSSFFFFLSGFGLTRLEIDDFGFRGVLFLFGKGWDGKGVVDWRRFI